MKNITYISAGAGSGKTTRIIEELVTALQKIRPSEVMMTTFTRTAAQEMQERAKKKLLELGKINEANEMGAATIGTIHSVCLRFIQKYWYLVGLSPDSQQMDENDFNSYVDQSLFEKVSTEDLVNFEEWRKVLGWTHKEGTITKPYVAYWRDWLRIMVNKARYYHIDDLELSREKSIEEINAVFDRHPFNKAKCDKCLEALQIAMENVRDTANTANTNKERRNYLATYNPLIAHGKIEIKSIAAIQEEYDALKAEAAKVVFCNEYREAAIAIVDKLFKILTAWRKEYQEYKKTKKMMDFNDMEVLFLELLKKPEVQAEIGKYQLVLVDEYQDCNPMQIDIFSRIADLVPRSIWVGDPKQAIYGFRGTDTTLVKEVSDKIVNGKNGCIRDCLEFCYRSREELVKHVKDIFLPIFSKEPFFLKDDEIKLEAGRKCKLDSPHLQSWTIYKNGNRTDYSGIAYNIKQLVELQETYVEPKNQPKRLAQYGDIAILARNNSTISKLTKALRDFGIPFFATEDNDNEKQPIEQKLLMALAQYKLSPKYRPHLRADILHLLKDISSQDLLNDYLKNISVSLDENNKRKYDKRDEWKTDDELIQRIEQIVKDCYAKGLYDTLTSFVDCLRLYDLIAKWGDAEIRRSNVHKILQLAEDFDHHCEILGIEKPTFADYAKYMDDVSAKTELDLNSPSVKILTMHKSKGLEWPIVIYYDGDNDFAEPEKIVEKEFFNIREQRIDRNKYWLRIFPCITDNSTSKELLYSEDYFCESKQRVEADETRLHYVSLTRARDMLITVTQDNAAEVYTPTAEPQQYTLIDTVKTQQEGSDLTYLVNPSKSGIASALKPSDPAKADRIHIPEEKADVRMSTIGTCIHNIYAACSPSMDDAQATEMAQRIIKSVNLSKILKAEEVIKAIRSLYDYLNQEHGTPTSIAHEVPFSFVRKNGQLLRGEMDLLWHTKDGVVLVDYKNIQGEEANPEHYASQMEAYREVLKSAGLACKGIFLFYATLGQIIELK